MKRRCWLLLVFVPALALAEQGADEARRYFEAGKQAYEAEQFAAAALAFDEAYRLEPRPAILFSLAQAHKAMVGGDLADAALRARFDKNVQAFLSLAEAAKHYPCIKRAWVEFLGEPPGSGADRVDH